MARCGCAQSCNCAVTAGTGVVVSGTGAAGNPYVIDATAQPQNVDDSNCVALAGDGTPGDPLIATLLPDTLSGGNLLTCGPNGALARLNTVDSDCLDVVGDGTVGTPLSIDPIIPLTQDHPLLGAGVPVIPGISCVPASGFNVGPYAFQFGGGGGLPIGSLPVISVDTAGFDAWGPALSVSFPNPSPFGQLFAANIYTTHPIVAVTLEPGASFEYGLSDGCPDPIGAPFFTTIMYSKINNSAVTESFSFTPSLGANGAIIAPAGTLDVCVVSRVRLTGSSGASSIASALFGSGVELNIFGGTV